MEKKIKFTEKQIKEVKDWMKEQVDQYGRVDSIETEDKFGVSFEDFIKYCKELGFEIQSEECD